jgi:hypothetical protein
VAEPKTFSLLGLDFTVTQPYAAGHTLTEGEAAALNQVRKENLANNFRPVVAKAKEESGDALSDEKIAELTTDLAERDAKYAFTLASVAASRKLDPIEKEARTLIKAQLRTQLEADGKKLSDMDDDAIEAVIEKNITNEKILEIARSVVASRKSIAGVSLTE